MKTFLLGNPNRAISTTLMHLGLFEQLQTIDRQSKIPRTTWIKEAVFHLDFEKVQSKQLRNRKLSNHMRRPILINKEN